MRVEGVVRSYSWSGGYCRREQTLLRKRKESAAVEQMTVKKEIESGDCMRNAQKDAGMVGHRQVIGLTLGSS
jgi:hypothetical protein